MINAYEFCCPFCMGRVQSIVFPKSDWDLNSARSWLRLHNYKIDVDETESTYRFRQRAPIHGRRYVTKTIQTPRTKKNIRLIVDLKKMGD